MKESNLHEVRPQAADWVIPNRVHEKGRRCDGTKASVGAPAPTRVRAAEILGTEQSGLGTLTCSELLRSVTELRAAVLVAALGS